jgi:hypothetical protein
MLNRQPCQKDQITLLASEDHFQPSNRRSLAFNLAGFGGEFKQSAKGSVLNLD